MRFIKCFSICVVSVFLFSNPTTLYAVGDKETNKKEEALNNNEDSKKEGELENQIDSLEKQSENSKSNKEKLKLQLEQKQTEINNTRNNIQFVQDKIDEIEQEINLINSQIYNLEQNILQVSKEIDKITEEMKVQEIILGQTISFLYENTDITYLEFFFRSENLEELYNAYEFIHIVMDENEEVYKEILFNKEKLSKNKEELVISRLALKSKMDQNEKLKIENITHKNSLSALLSDKEKEQLNLFNKIKTEELIEQQASSEIIKYIQQLEYLNKIKSEENNSLDFNLIDTPFVTSTTLSTPLPGYTISSEYGLRFHPVLQYSRMHNGVDLGGVFGEPMYSAGEGIIVFAGPAKGYGNWIVIYHGLLNSKNIYTIYGHMEANQIVVQSNQIVKKGEIIAAIGNAGTSTGPHLHFSIAEGFNGSVFNYVDPKKYMEFK